MRIVRLLALPAAVAALLAFGWTYDVPGPPPPPLSGAEVGWVAAVREWLKMPPAERCATALEEAPSDRLGSVEDAFADACAEEGSARAAERMRAARARLVGELRDRRELVVEGGLSGRSRIEPRLGEVLTALGEGGPVEVRCWAQSDWRGVLAEEAALTGVTRPREAIWLPAERSLQLQGLHCGPLVQLGLGRQPRRRAQRVDLALALWTVAGAAEPCLLPSRLAMALGAPRGYVVGLERFASRDLGPLLPPVGERCARSQPT
jgi:hypothetical protein